MRTVLSALLAAALLWCAPASAQSDDASGLAVPRMVSVKSAEANVRTGPGVDYPIRWVYRRLGAPVEVIAEFENWRKIRDWEGDEGWVHFALLSSRQSVIVTVAETTLRQLAADAAPAVARLAQGMVARVERCEPDWCEVSVNGYDGWVRRTDVWGSQTGEPAG
ncbi:MAG: SH3 domain-containing protein [Alphaproteobacteria bacterium]